MVEVKIWLALSGFRVYMSVRVQNGLNAEEEVVDN